MGPGMAFHSGGIVGVDGTPRSFHPSWFANAPRLHSGGLLPDEVPAILQRGERVVPRGRATNGGNTYIANFHIHNPIDATGFRKTQRQAADDWGRHMQRVTQ